MQGVFQNINNLETITLGDGFTLKSVETTQDMFNGCTDLAFLDCTKFGEAPKLKTTLRMFKACANIINWIPPILLLTSCKICLQIALF